MEDQPGALEHCARMNNQRMTMREITELMELVTAMLFAFRRWKGSVKFVTQERLHAKWPTMKRTNMGLLAGSRCCSRAPLDGLVAPSHLVKQGVQGHVLLSDVRLDTETCPDRAASSLQNSSTIVAWTPELLTLKRRHGDVVL